MVSSRKGRKGRVGSARRGRASVDKGKNFEEEVADLYRLLGATVVPNIEICQKKVDILATFLLPGSTTGHRVIVECKDEKKAVSQNQRVMQFSGLLDLARKAGEAESAEIITRNPWSDQAKGFARAQGIGLLTYEEKVAQLMDFGPYLKSVISYYEEGLKGHPSEPPLAAYYVESDAQLLGQEEKEISDLDAYIRGWLEDRTTRHLAILGEYGTGKTCFCQKVTHDLATSWLAAPGTTRIPLLFNLRDFTKTLSIEALITSFLDSVCGIANPRFKLFETMNRAGAFLLIFDGFDEMAVRVDADTLEINLREIEKLVAPGNSKVILTSRLEYFVSAEEQARVLQPRGQLLATRDVEYQPIQIKPWDDDKIERFLQKRVPLIPNVKEDWTFYRDQIQNIPGLSDLAKRPVLLDMIVKTLPQLIASGVSINRPNLYYTYLIGELKRQKVVKKRILLLTEARRLSVLQDLALQFYQEEEASITFSDSLEYIDSCLQPPRTELEAYARDFLNCSFLVREADQFRFSHRSIMEYLVAKGLYAEIEAKKPEAFKKQKLEWVVASFLAEMNPAEQTLLGWIEETKSSVPDESKYQGGNAITLLCMRDPSFLIGKDFSDKNLTGARFLAADLTTVNLASALLKEVDLSSAKFSEEGLGEAQLYRVVFGLLFHLRITGTEHQKIFERRDLFGDFSKVIRRSGGALLLAGRESSMGKDHVFFHTIVRCKDLVILERVRKTLLTKFPVYSSAIYADEIEKLVQALPMELANAVEWVKRMTPHWT